MELLVSLRRDEKRKTALKVLWNVLACLDRLVMYQGSNLFHFASINNVPEI